MQRGLKAFLLMPFAPELEWLRDEILAAGKSVGVEVKRADDIFAPGIIIDQVKSEILSADIVIAVCSGQNANVFYEMGIAEQRHRPIIIAESKEDLPFDVKHFRAQFYGQDRTNLREKIAASIREAVATPPVPSSAITLSGKVSEGWAYLLLENHGPAAEFEVWMDELLETGRREESYAISWRDAGGRTQRLLSGAKALANVASSIGENRNDKKVTVKFYSVSLRSGFDREIPFGSRVICRIRVSADPPLPMKYERQFDLIIDSRGQFAEFRPFG